MILVDSGHQIPARRRAKLKCLNSLTFAVFCSFLYIQSNQTHERQTRERERDLRLVKYKQIKLKSQQLVSEPGSVFSKFLSDSAST